MSEQNKFWQLIHPGGPKGLLTKEPEFREQDAEAKPTEAYVVAFFPKITQLGHASLNWPRVAETLSNSPEAAIVKFMDGIKKGESWETYQDAGHRVRKVRIVDLGDATP